MSASRDLALIFEIDKAFSRLESIVAKKGYPALRWDYVGEEYIFALSHGAFVSLQMRCPASTHIEAIMRWFESLPLAIGYVPPAEIEGA